MKNPIEDKEKQEKLLKKLFERLPWIAVAAVIITVVFTIFELMFLKH